VCATSSDEALELLASGPCDLLVSDKEQAADAGRSLLAEVKGRYPSIVRLMILDAGEQAAAARASGDAHMYLPRACSAELLRASISRATALRDVLTNARLLELVRRLEHLPSMPTLYFELVEAMKDPNATIESLGGIIARDIGMTGKVLKLVNSPLFGLREKIVAPGQAATFLGLDTLKSLVLSVGVHSQFDQKQLTHLSAQETWDHSMKVAAYTRALLQCEHASKAALEEGFLAGMMHDAGKLVLASNRPERFHAASVFADRDDGNHGLRTDLERRLFGASHAAIGGYLLGQWGLPSTVIEAVLFHHSPRLWLGDDFGPLCAVHVANALAHVDLDDPDAELTELDEPFLERLGLAGRLPRWIEACRALDRVATAT
jgi:HD-like signal output (HDOD) protein